MCAESLQLENGYNFLFPKLLWPPNSSFLFSFSWSIWVDWWYEENTLAKARQDVSQGYLALTFQAFVFVVQKPGLSFWRMTWQYGPPSTRHPDFCPQLWSDQKPQAGIAHILRSPASCESSRQGKQWSDLWSPATPCCIQLHLACSPCFHQHSNYMLSMHLGNV